jgi:hypothetical protein
VFWQIQANCKENIRKNRTKTNERIKNIHQNMKQQMKLSFGYCILTLHIPEPSGTRQSAKNGNK